MLMLVQCIGLIKFIIIKSLSTLLAHILSVNQNPNPNRINDVLEFKIHAKLLV